jgi:hypothetical protein
LYQQYSDTGGFGAPGSGGATNVASANGGDGEMPGSGGGGSGATLNGSTPGRGGHGGPGAVWVTFFHAFPAMYFPQWIGAAVNWTMDSVSFIRHLGIETLNGYNQ